MKEQKYDKSQIMKNAWANFKKYKANAIRNNKEEHKTFGECLKMAWAAYKRDQLEETETEELNFADMM